MNMRAAMAEVTSNPPSILEAFKVAMSGLKWGAILVFGASMLYQMTPSVKFTDMRVPDKVYIGRSLTYTTSGVSRPGCIMPTSRTLRYKDGSWVLLTDTNAPNLSYLAQADAYMARRYPDERMPPIRTEQKTSQAPAAQQFTISSPLPLPSMYVHPGRAYLELQVDEYACGLFHGMYPVRTHPLVSNWFDVLPDPDAKPAAK